MTDKDIEARRHRLPVILGGDGLTTAELMDDYTRFSREYLEARREVWQSAWTSVFDMLRELDGE